MARPLRHHSPEAGPVKAGRLLRLRRADGAIYLQRWGISTRRFGVYLHRMDAADPGLDLHDHPWPFVSLVLRGGYTEERAKCDDAPFIALLAERWPETCQRGATVDRPQRSLKKLGIGECHRVTSLTRVPTWTLVIRGRIRRDRADQRRLWGFWLPSGWMDEHTYDETVRVQRRDLEESLDRLIPVAEFRMTRKPST